MGREAGTRAGQVWAREPVSWPFQTGDLPPTGPTGQIVGKDPLRSGSFQKNPGWQHFPSH